MSVKIIHCADIHLGANPKMKNEVLSAFLRIIDISKDYDFLLVSGDLFDNPVSDRETVEIIKAKLSLKESSSKGLLGIIKKVYFR